MLTHLISQTQRTQAPSLPLPSALASAHQPRPHGLRCCWWEHGAITNSDQVNKLSPGVADMVSVANKMKCEVSLGDAANKVKCHLELIR